MTVAWYFAVLVCALALVASIRLSLPASVGAKFGMIGHPVLLFPLLLTVPMTVGLLVTGQISPWPPAVQEAAAIRFGEAAGIAALLTIITAELWLLWTPSIIARRFARDGSRGATRGLPLVNLAFGTIVLALIAVLY